MQAPKGAGLLWLCLSIIYSVYTLPAQPGLRVLPMDTSACSLEVSGFGSASDTLLSSPMSRTLCQFPGNLFCSFAKSCCQPNKQGQGQNKKNSLADVQSIPITQIPSPFYKIPKAIPILQNAAAQIFTDTWGYRSNLPHLCLSLVTSQF